MPRSTERSNFAQIPLSLLNDTRPEVTAYVRLVYAAIHSYCTFGTTTGAYPSTEQLAKRMGCSERQVNRAREALRALGYVWWKTGSKRHNQGNLYTLYPAGDGPGEEFKSAPQALEPVPHRHSDLCPTGTPQRVRDREPETEKYRGKAACSHPSTVCCPKCLTPTVVSPPKSEPQDDEDF